MTLVTEETGGTHVADMRLRRFRIGELDGAEKDEVARHTADCGPCRARLKTIEDEQRLFERDISFERFAGGVERARRVPRATPRRVWTFGVVALAAAAGLVLVVRPQEQRNNLKGDGLQAQITIAASDGTQRTIEAGTSETLQAGERIRIGYRTASPRFLVALSVDEAGQVTPIYPERGSALRVDAREVTFLPDSLQFTGRGRERLYLLLSSDPLTVEEVAQAARSGAVTLVPKGGVTQYTWLLHKQ